MNLRKWNLVFLIALVAYLTIRAAFDRTKRVEKFVSRMDRTEKILLLIVIAGSLLFPLLYLFTPLLGFANYRLPTFAPWCGAVVMVAALWLFWRSHVDLGDNWSVTLELRKGHQLVRHGVYRWIRHPMYASIWLFGLGQGLLLENWLAGWSACASFAAMYFIRVPREERMMCEFFGDEYLTYARKTGRVFPRLIRPGKASGHSSDQM